MHQPRSVIDAGLVYWGSHESEPQKTQQLGCVSCLRVGIVEVGLLSFGHSPITVTNARRSFEDEVDDTYYTHTYRQTNKQTRTSRQTHKQTHSERQTDRQTDTYTERQTSNHTYKQTHEHTGHLRPQKRPTTNGERPILCLGTFWGRIAMTRRVSQVNAGSTTFRVPNAMRSEI